MELTKGDEQRVAGLPITRLAPDGPHREVPELVGDADEGLNLFTDPAGALTEFEAEHRPNPVTSNPSESTIMDASACTGTAEPRKRRQTARRWCIPPAITREPEETIEGSPVLDEHRSDLGLLLWGLLRDVLLWAAVFDRREGLFGPGAAQNRNEHLQGVHPPPVLEFPLTVLAALSAAPAHAHADSVRAACTEVAGWCEGQAAPGSALAFAQAAALVVPEDAGPAEAVGAMALRFGRSARAETWLRRSIGLARRARDWKTYAEAYVELGRLYAGRGSVRQAARYYVQAIRAARRNGLSAIRGAALHGLFLLEMDARQLEDAERHARAAVRAYGRGHPRLAELLHDIAALWVLQGTYQRALPLLRKLLPSRAAPPERAWTLALLAHAAAGAGEQRTYEETWARAWSIITAPGNAENHSGALVELARAAAVVRDWPRIDQATRAHAARPWRLGEGQPRVTEEMAELAAMVRAARS